MQPARTVRTSTPSVRGPRLVRALTRLQWHNGSPGRHAAGPTTGRLYAAEQAAHGRVGGITGLGLTEPGAKNNSADES